MAEFAICATTVAFIDLTTKQIAAARLGLHGTLRLPPFDGVRLAVVLNDQSAFGVSLGRYTWHINLALTVVALLLAVVLCRTLAALDTWAPVMLGLVAGAAIGNLASLITSPAESSTSSRSARDTRTSWYSTWPMWRPASASSFSSGPRGRSCGRSR